MSAELNPRTVAEDPTHLVGHQRVFDVASDEDLLYSLSADGTRKFMHPVVKKGYYWKIRRAIAYGLVVVFLGLPWVSVAGHPAVFLDIAARRFHIFGATFYPTDNLLLVALGFGTIVTVFFVGSTFGRMWCGYTCPQTVWLEFVFRPIEVWLEGGPTNQKRLNLAPWDGKKIAIKSAKWLAWIVVALLMSSTFVSYFTSWRALLHGVATNPLAWKGALSTILFVGAAIVFDFGWFRDQMCTIACPYGRLQNVLADQDTLVVAYDARRGDPKVRLKDRQPGVLAGDCIACKACVSACPTGTDIRRGLQPECIGTAQCVDACNEVMRGQQKPIGLIKYTSDRQLAGGQLHLWRPRNLAYIALMTVAWGALVTMLVLRGDALVEVMRGGREPYRLLPTGEVANQQRIRITNQLPEPQQFTIEVLEPKGTTLVLSESPVLVAPEKIATLNAVATVPRSAFVDGQVPVRYLVRSDRGFSKEVRFLLLGPYSASGGTR